MLTDADKLTTHGDPAKPIILNDLGCAFLARFERLGELSDLEDAISMQWDAVNLTPHDHPAAPGKFEWLSNLGSSFNFRFKRLGELNDLQNAISMHRDAVDLTPDGQPRKPSILTNLADTLVTRFSRLGELSDLDDAISTLSDAIALASHGHPEKPLYLGNLGNAFRARFERLGDLSDLEHAISMYRDAVDLTPHGHPHLPRWLNNLGSCFRLRFQRLGDPSDLERAISTLGDALDLTPHDHPHKPTLLNSLGNSLKFRFECLEELSDLQIAIFMHSDAIDLTPHGHPDKPGWLNNLALCFLLRFHHLDELSDLENAISTLRDAVDIAPHGHPRKLEYLNTLGFSIFTRFERLGELSDLEVAISRLKDVVDLIPDGHPVKPARLYTLGNFFFTRFENTGELSNLQQAISLYLHAASSPSGTIKFRFLAAQKWIESARRIRHHSLLHAYSVAIDLLPQLAWIGLSLTDRYRELKEGADVVREAAAAALDSGLRESAVEWLEQGRSIVWGELFQLRSSYEELSTAHPDHAHRLRELSAALEHASANHETTLSALLEEAQIAAHRPTESSEQDAVRHRLLAIERDKLLHEIRGFPGFERFLLHKDFSELRASAHSGPLVLLNAAETRCDALIILADVDHVIHVPLLKFPFTRSAGLQKMLDKLLGNARGSRSDDRKGDPSTRGVSWESLLSTLWNDVVKPILHALAFSIPGDLSRIFWCPTGPFVFLPIHGAGFYDTQHREPGHKVSDFVVSSYLPTLSILAPSPNPAAIHSGDLRLFAVRQPPSDGLPHLTGVATELEHIRAVIKNPFSARVDMFQSFLGTVEEVLALMKEADWVHFACHGIQEGVDSGLCLADRRRLKLRDIIALSRPHGGLAFLSACETATGDTGLSDEAIHIAAGMLFAGYGGVVGTMWTINDEIAPRVARDVYEQLFRNGTRPDYREAARALHDAIGRLRDSVNAPFDKWLPFIHVGL
ncbi:hypothetical protein OG21DRAFT_667971 [Imleria badia]|nr:hypothetical protein OG21DRAFT_667971 [Imleria badia]